MNLYSQDYPHIMIIIIEPRTSGCTLGIEIYETSLKSASRMHLEMRVVTKLIVGRRGRHDVPRSL